MEILVNKNYITSKIYMKEKLNNLVSVFIDVISKIFQNTN